MSKHTPGEQWLYPVVHFSAGLTEEEATDQVLTAMQNIGADVAGWTSAPLTPAERKATAASPTMTRDTKTQRLAVALAAAADKRAGQTSDTFPCRWGCGERKSYTLRRDWHETDTHGSTWTGALATEADKLKAERDALRTALAGLVAEVTLLLAQAGENEAKFCGNQDGFCAS
jgi:nucleoid-associated protein YgaU